MNGPIICGVDGSDSARGAARVARALSSELGRPVVFVRAIDRRADDAAVSTFAERLERLSEGVNESDCGAAWSVEVGHPVDALVTAAKRTQATMIVVGSTGPRSSLLGSVSADVSRRAPCPVVVVPPGADAAVDERADGGSPSARDFAGGIARLGIGNGGTDFAGGIARFGLRSGEEG
ncbi:MAG TPA: universal stress protein [Gaiellaceae bacterium]|nr:universal stress protein [Gaiellaceae bacterium]